MAFKKPYLQTLGRFSSSDLLVAQGAVWFYTSADTPAAIRAAGYFNNARTQLAVGDIILVDAGGTIRHLKVATLPADGVSNVTVTDMAPGGKVFVGGQLTTVTAADTVVTGLASVSACGVSLDSDPSDDPEWFSATIGDQAGAPVAGSIIIKGWKNTAGNDPTPLAATTFAKKVNWWAVGVL